MVRSNPIASCWTAAQATERSAAIFAVVAKPFEIDELVDTVARAVGAVARFDRSDAADLERTETVVQRPRAMGATDVRSSAMGILTSVLRCFR